MDSEPKQKFNSQLMPQQVQAEGSHNTNFYISPQKRISGLIKTGDLNALENFFNSADSGFFDINELDKDLRQTILYQAVQIKDKSLAFYISKLLIENGVIT